MPLHLRAAQRQACSGRETCSLVRSSALARWALDKLLPVIVGYSSSSYLEVNTGGSGIQVNTGLIG